MSNEHFNRSISKNRYHWLILLVLVSGFFILGFSLDSFDNILNGIIKIILSSSVLLSGYIAIGGIGAALVHNAIFILLLLVIIWVNKVELTGKVLANVFMPAGFAFFGVNIVNVLPFILGAYLYSKYKKKDFAEYIPLAFNLGALGPVFSVIAFHLQVDYKFALPIATLCCMLIGFFIPSLAEKCFKFHQGYTMYNVGFTTGLVGILVYSLLDIFNFKVERQNLLIEVTIYHLLIFFLIYFLFVLFLGIFLERKFTSYGKLIQHSGHNEVFLDYFGTGTTLINMGIMGLLSIGFIFLIGANLTGPIIGGILSVFGYAAIGKHPLNTVPVVGGILLSAFVADAELASSGVLITCLFGTALAPISGTFSFVLGIIAGFLHYAISRMTSAFHGGLDLYNNGFASGFVAIILANILFNLPPALFREKNTNC